MILILMILTDLTAVFATADAQIGKKQTVLIHFSVFTVFIFKQ